MKLGYRATHFAYPYGDISDAVTAAAGSTFSFSHTTEMASVRVANDTARLPRLDMYYYQSPAALDSFGTPGFARRIAWIRTRRAVKALVSR